MQPNWGRSVARRRIAVALHDIEPATFERCALIRDWLSPSLIRLGGMLCDRTLRLDLHPTDLQNSRHMIALEWVLGHAGHRRQAITYDELLAGA